MDWREVWFVCPVSKFEEVDYVRRGVSSMLKITRNVLLVGDFDTCRKYGGYLCVESPHVGAGYARELGYDMIRNEVEYIIFSDAHVYYHDKAKQYLERILTYMENDPTIGMIVPKIGIWDNYGLHDDAYTDGSYHTYWSLQWIILQNPTNRIVPIPSSNEPIFIVRKKLLDDIFRVRGFIFLPYWGFENHDIGIMAWRLGYKVLNYPLLVGYHRYRENFPKGRLEDKSLYRRENWYVDNIDSPFSYAYMLNMAMYILCHYPPQHSEQMIKRHGLEPYLDKLPISIETVRNVGKMVPTKYDVYRQLEHIYRYIWR